MQPTQRPPDRGSCEEKSQAGLKLQDQREGEALDSMKMVMVS